jgi:Membrane protein involved in the export of O-antigen and teichoic acid
MQLFNLLITAILARLLLPEDFGLVGMSLIIIGLVSLINESGLATAIVQRKELEELHLFTAFWTNIATGILLYIGTFFLSPFIADFFKTEAVELVIKVAAISFMISSITIVHRSLLSRNLEFKTIAKTEIAGSLISGFIALYLALSGFGFWSLVAKNLINDLVVVSLTLLIYPWKPAIKFSRDKFNDLFGFGFNVIGGNMLNYFRQNLDYIIIGRVMGAELLGYYTLAYTLAVFPAVKVIPVITRVIFPAFSLLQDDNVRFRKGYMKLVSALSFFIMPALVGLAIVAPELIILVYGEKWAPTIIPLQILCIVGLIEATSQTTKSVFYAKGIPGTELKLNVAKIVISTCVILLGSSYGISGVAAALSLISLIYFSITQQIVNTIIQLSWKEYFNGTKEFIFAAAFMGSLLIVYKYWAFDIAKINEQIIFISSIAIGIIVYTIAIHKLRPDYSKTGQSAIKKLTSGKLRNIFQTKNN